MAWSTLKAAIDAIVKANGLQEITGTNLNQVLDSIIDNLGQNAMFNGIATPVTVPGSPDGSVFYLASEVGVYSNFSSLEITKLGLYVLSNVTGAWAITEIVDLNIKSFTLDENDVINYSRSVYIDGSYINPSGVEVVNPDWSATDFIPLISSNLFWKSYGYVNSAVMTAAFYDSGYNFLGVIPQADNVAGFYAPLPSNVAFVRLSGNKSTPYNFIIGGSLEIRKQVYDISERLI
ncbi:MAG: hypothetical protein HQ522_07825, partial [Bacteroidetes bacterium]|nr:hypothetical protein [Bacteroidota bacterium]